MRIWIDLSNSPHPLLFAPVARRFESLGQEVLVTARDNAQTVELARERWPDVEVIGGPSPHRRASKGRLVAERVRKLASWARAERPDAAISHNSYAQIVAARALGIRTVTAMDYEHQPANHIAFRLAGSVLLPAVLARTNVDRMGATRLKTRFYDGLKEELYLGDFSPDPGVLAAAGVDRDDGAVLIVARTPPSGALYHRSDNPLFAEVLRVVCKERQARCVVLTRRPEQRRDLIALGLPNVVFPEGAVDARSLMYASDLVIGAGGTMTREGALIGVPTLSLFSGRTPEVDRWLEERGDLRRIQRVRDLPPVGRREVEPHRPEELRARSERLIEQFVAAVVHSRSPPPRPPPGRVRAADQAAAESSEAGREARALARRLSHWAAERAWRGTDPYEGLNASRPIVAPLKRTALGRRLLIQAVKRSPVDLRPTLGIQPRMNAAAVAWMVSAYARNGFLPHDDAQKLLTDALGCLDGLRLADREEPCWGYPFDVQSRVFFYSRREPNTIATAFAGHALLDAHASLGDPTLLETARGAGRFFLRRVPQTDAREGAYFGYLPGDRSPIHNSNLLAASLLARLAALGVPDEGFGSAAAAAVRYSTGRQRADGSWPYGERPNLAWVDNFHTGYVLDALRACADAGVAEAEAEEAWGRGVAYYRRALFLQDGTPKYYSTRVLPVDAQSLAQGIQTLSIAARHDRSCADQAWTVFGFASRRMLGDDGLPIFQRRRIWSNRAHHFRWVVAPMPLALTHLLAVERPTAAVRPEPRVGVVA